MTVTQRKHDVSVVIAGKQVTGWISYVLTSSILDPVDTATFTMPWSRAAWDLFAPDAPIKVTLDGVVVLDGFLDDRETPADDDTITISARDRCGRLVQESAPGIDWRGLTLVQLIAKLAAPWFTKVTLSNARNRKVLLGKGKHAVTGSEPVRIDPRVDGLLAEPGQMRWEIIERLLDQAGMIAWSAGDGTELVIGKPNYDQEAQWAFFRPAPGSSRSREGNCSIGVRDSTADRYSRVIVVGGGRGTTSNYGAVLSSRYGEAKDNPGTAEGTGRAFSAPKRLIVQAPTSSIAEAKATAERTLRGRAAHGEVITVRAPAHGQLLAGTRPTLFCPDTMAHVEDERTGRKGLYLVTTCRFESDRKGGERTNLDLVPTGTELSS